MGTEKATGYYLANHLFWAKMAVFTLVVLLEVGPAVGLTRWRAALRRGVAPDTSLAPRWAAISRVEAALVLALLCLATAMARGYGAR
jgi:putative membrane protein